MKTSFLLSCYFAVFTTAASLFAADQASSITFELAPEFPIGMPTIVSGTIDRVVKPGSTFAVQHPSLGKLVGQVETLSNQVFFATEVHSDMVGRRIALDAKASENIARVKIERSDEGFTFLSEKRAVLFYQREPVTEHNHTRAGYVHPLNGLDGEVFTEVFPKDHLHHQGVFWAWHQLWVGDRKVGDPWVTKDHLLVVKQAEIIEQGPVFATLDVRAEWTSTALGDSGEAQALVAEQTSIRVYHAVRDVQYVDFTIQLTPLLPNVKLGGSDDAKGYSGFTVRVKPPHAMVIQDAHGVLEGDAIQSTSPWADVSGSFAEGGTSGVAILTHPSSPIFPARWVLRHYGMQNVAYPGREPVPLSAAEPLIIRHRLVLHRGNTEAARIADHQRVYELTP